MLHPHLIHRLGAERRRDLTAESARARTSGLARRSRRALLAAAVPAALAAAALPAASR
jgi:hypothetical protein